MADRTQNSLGRNERRQALLSYAHDSERAAILAENLVDRSYDITLLVPSAPDIAQTSYGAQLVMSIIRKANGDQLKLLCDQFVCTWPTLEATMESPNGVAALAHLLRTVIRQQRESLAHDILLATPHWFWHDTTNSFPVLDLVLPYMKAAEKETFILESSDIFMTILPHSPVTPLFQHLGERTSPNLEIMKSAVPQWIAKENNSKQKMVVTILRGSQEQSEFVLKWWMWLRPHIKFNVRKFVGIVMGDNEIDQHRQSTIMTIIADDLMSEKGLATFTSLISEERTLDFIIRTINQNLRLEIARLLRQSKCWDSEMAAKIDQLTQPAPAPAQEKEEEEEEEGEEEDDDNDEEDTPALAPSAHDKESQDRIESPDIIFLEQAPSSSTVDKKSNEQPTEAPSKMDGSNEPNVLLKEGGDQIPGESLSEQGVSDECETNDKAAKETEELQIPSSIANAPDTPVSALSDIISPEEVDGGEVASKDASSCQPLPTVRSVKKPIVWEEKGAVASSIQGKGMKKRKRDDIGEQVLARTFLNSINNTLTSRIDSGKIMKMASRPVRPQPRSLESSGLAVTVVNEEAKRPMVVEECSSAIGRVAETTPPLPGRLTEPPSGPSSVVIPSPPSSVHGASSSSINASSGMIKEEKKEPRDEATPSARPEDGEHPKKEKEDFAVPPQEPPQFIKQHQPIDQQGIMQKAKTPKETSSINDEPPEKRSREEEFSEESKEDCTMVPLDPPATPQLVTQPNAVDQQEQMHKEKTPDEANKLTRSGDDAREEKRLREEEKEDSAVSRIDTPATSQLVTQPNPANKQEFLHTEIKEEPLDDTYESAIQEENYCYEERQEGLEDKDEDDNAVPLIGAPTSSRRPVYQQQLKRKGGEKSEAYKKWMPVDDIVLEENKGRMGDVMWIDAATDRVIVPPVDQRELICDLESSILSEFAADFDFVTERLRNRTVPNTREVAKLVVENAEALCTRSYSAIHLLEEVASRFPGSRLDIALNVASKIASLCATETGRNLLRILMEGGTVREYLNPFFFEGGDGSPFIILLNEDKDLAAVVFNNDESSQWPKFVREHIEAIKNTNHGHLLIRRLLDDGFDLYGVEEKKQIDTVSAQFAPTQPSTSHEVAPEPRMKTVKIEPIEDDVKIVKVVDKRPVRRHASPHPHPHSSASEPSGYQPDYAHDAHYEHHTPHPPPGPPEHYPPPGHQAGYQWLPYYQPAHPAPYAYQYPSAYYAPPSHGPPKSAPLTVEQKIAQTGFMEMLRGAITNGTCDLGVFNLVYKNKFPDPIEAISLICQKARTLCSPSAGPEALNLLTMVAHRHPNIQHLIAKKIETVAVVLSGEEKGRVLLKVLLQPSVMNEMNEWKRIIAYNFFQHNSTAFPIFQVLENDKDLAWGLFIAVESEMRADFVKLHKESILETKFGLACLRSLIETGLLR